VHKATALAALSVLFALTALADGTETLPTPEWAIPKEGPERAGSKPEGEVTLPGSDLALTQEQIDNPFDTPNWYPDEHEPMPSIVKHGNEPDTWACAMCHLASGNGHPQSAKLAGNSADYLLRQLEAFEAGDRSSYLGVFIDDLHKIEDRSDAVSAAKWFAALPPRRHQKVIETQTVPRTTFDGKAFMRIVAKGPDGQVETEPLNGRIIEVPENYELVKARSPKAVFLTYVPPGSVTAGEVIAKRGVRGVAPCVSCHGPELQGTALGPALAGAFPTYIIRQLYDFRNGTRKGLADTTGYMSTSSRLLTAEEIVNVAAYIGSLPP
jgi:cytochrome c553